MKYSSTEVFRPVLPTLPISSLSELGKVDQGGGGTVALYIASRNVDVIDVGVPVLLGHHNAVIDKAGITLLMHVGEGGIKGRVYVSGKALGVGEHPVSGSS